MVPPIFKEITMRLEDMFPNFLTSSYEEQRSFIASYREARAKDMYIEPTRPTKRIRETSKINVLSDAEKAVLKKLGISAKDYCELNVSDTNGVDDDDNSDGLFEDDSFNFEEDI